ncbi:glutathione S-transferase family protein [Vitiosangium sp. GDMCC 1.1324]|uniref:glutathione S-transferase family protein n=1 Tax=Vitiosangium sp. (strain GDMCC 1.1324) TaxID=2138576 RepID=UPI000D335436|nr:glutathione S-transferase family protein [Vitiosangium sp. GDMCC 1.1324]PTL84666.1 glutathione S-transferase family protein [Vitiosangium sp. GDMCC 1.1324]
MTTPRFVLHYAPRSRSFRILWLLEEARVPYELVRYDLQKGTHKSPAYLAVNPDGKVPALVDRGPRGDWSAVITESAAICAYIADTLPEARLAPAVGTPERAAYATWMAYGAAALEPSFADLMFPRKAEPPPSAIGWPSFDATIARISRAVEKGPWLLGDQFSSADIMIGAMLQWLNSWGKLPAHEPVKRYLAALVERDAMKRAQAKEAELAAG